MASRKYSIPDSTLIVPVYGWQKYYSLDILDGKNNTSWCVRKHQELMERHSDKLSDATGKSKKKRAKKRMYVKKSAGFAAVDLVREDWSYVGSRTGWEQAVEKADYQFVEFSNAPVLSSLSEENILYMNQVTSRLDKIIRGVCMYLVARPRNKIYDGYDERVVGMIYSHPQDTVLVSSQVGLVGAHLVNG